MAEELRDPPEKGVTGELQQDRAIGDKDLTRGHTRAGRFLADTLQRISRRLGPNGALILSLLAGSLIAATLTYLFANVYDAVTRDNGVSGLDHPVLAAAQSVRSPTLDAMVTAYTNIGGGVGMPVIAVIALVILGLRRRSWTPVILVAVAGLGSMLMITAGKQLVGRSRPEHIDAVPPFEFSAAFPSGHALGSVVVAGIVAYLVILRRKTAWGRFWTVAVASVFAVSMGLSRVYLGHHWLTDVLGAWALGGAWLVLVITVHRTYLTVRERRSAPGRPKLLRASRRNR